MSVFAWQVNACQNFSDLMAQTVLPLMYLVVHFLLLCLVVLVLLLSLDVLVRRLPTTVLESAGPRLQSNVPINYQVEYLMTLLDDDQVYTEHAIKTTLRERCQAFRQLKSKSAHEVGKYILKVLMKRHTHIPTVRNTTWSTTITGWLAAVVSPTRFLLAALTAAACGMTKITVNFTRFVLGLLLVNARRRPAVSAVPDVQVPNFPHQDDIDLKGSRLQGEDLRLFRQLSWLFHDHAETTWLVDTEFISLVGKGPVFFAFSIRTLSGRELLSNTIDYDGMSLWDMSELLSPFLTKNPTTKNCRLGQLRPQFVKYYKGNLRTSGISFSKLRDELMLAGLSQDHTIISWGSTVDLVFIKRILHADHDGPIHDDPIKVSQCLDVQSLCLKMLPLRYRRQDNSSMRLERIHPLLLPGVARPKFHDPSEDTKAFQHVLRVMVNAANS
ncbi:hypothetical protein LTR20_009706 [Exophiala xenobiotica]|nr:hypothetical protein LTS13_008340 [Exophiala xenobiotica]KAK5392211.1 hypothetical protein LTR79_010183 [Exophiala xenobiotica]KAK5408903.1 hypothetical protein LTR90_009521 [Exophiala xenobiotica]KAK5455800.1 hypothetical protein LTR20_009706 [Exophiala xenobiotica]KAK5474123.1 hypothetical protein LTR26_010127 [Exophiala xenobiotica]